MMGLLYIEIKSTIFFLNDEIKQSKKDISETQINRNRTHQIQIALINCVHDQFIGEVYLSD